MPWNSVVVSCSEMRYTWWISQMCISETGVYPKHGHFSHFTLYILQSFYFMIVMKSNPYIVTLGLGGLGDILLRFSYV